MKTLVLMALLTVMASCALAGELLIQAKVYEPEFVERRHAANGLESMGFSVKESPDKARREAEARAARELREAVGLHQVRVVRGVKYDVARSTNWVTMPSGTRSAFFSNGPTNGCLIIAVRTLNKPEPAFVAVTNLARGFVQVDEQLAAFRALPVGRVAIGDRDLPLLDVGRPDRGN